VVGFADGSSLKLTIAEWFTPLGRAINSVGVKPDFEVKREPGDRDDQMLKALDLLR
jgi:carboxyl-terminal processing protease